MLQTVFQTSTEEAKENLGQGLGTEVGKPRLTGRSSQPERTVRENSPEGSPMQLGSQPVQHVALILQLENVASQAYV